MHCYFCGKTDSDILSLPSCVHYDNLYKYKNYVYITKIENSRSIENLIRFNNFIKIHPEMNLKNNGMVRF